MQGAFAVIRCNSEDRGLVKLFLQVAGAIVHLVDHALRQADLSVSIIQVATIFRQLQRPSAATLKGLSDELLTKGD